MIILRSAWSSHRANHPIGWFRFEAVFFSQKIVLYALGWFGLACFLPGWLHVNARDAKTIDHPGIILNCASPGKVKNHHRSVILIWTVARHLVIIRKFCQKAPSSYTSSYRSSWHHPNLVPDAHYVTVSVFPYMPWRSWPIRPHKYVFLHGITQKNNIPWHGVFSRWALGWLAHGHHPKALGWSS